MPRVLVPRTCSTAFCVGLVLAILTCVLTLEAAFGAGSATAAHTRHAASAAAHRLTTTPPVPLSTSSPTTPSNSRVTSSHAASTATGAGSATRLPATGYDAATAALLGVGLMAAGLGLRRLTADGRRP